MYKAPSVLLFSPFVVSRIYGELVVLRILCVFFFVIVVAIGKYRCLERWFSWTEVNPVARKKKGLWIFIFIFDNFFSVCPFLRFNSLSTFRFRWPTPCFLFRVSFFFTLVFLVCVVLSFYCILFVK